jgi:hypothetical protein
VLTRQVNAFVEDVLPVLRSIRPRSAAVNGGEVEVLRTAIERDVRRISAEVARRDGPRTKLVDTLLEGLAGTFDEFHEAVLFDPSPNLESVGDEVQEADLDYVEASISSIQDLWDDFDPDGGLAGRLSKGALYLDVIAQTVRQLREAAVRVGFSDGEQRVTPFLPDDPDSLTVADLLDWTDRMAGPEGARMIAELGEPGLQSVGREADALFDLLEERFEQVGSRSSRDPLCVGEVDDELRTLHAQLQLLLTQA